MQSFDAWISTFANRLQPVKLYTAHAPRLAEVLAVLESPLPESWTASLDGKTDAGEAVELIWSTLHERARGWVTRLATITDGFGLAVDPEGLDAPRLAYLSRWGGEAHAWLAGLPVGDASVVACEQRLGSSLPASLKRFYQVHDGLLENGAPNVGFCTLAALQTLPGRPELLPFFGDEYGDRQCFDLSAPVGHGDFTTATWDHKLDITRRPQSFWSFLKELTVRGFG